MKKPKTGPPTFLDFWKDQEGGDPEGPPESLDEALQELVRFARLPKMNDVELKRMKANATLMGHLNTVCRGLRKNLAEQKAVPARTHKHTQRIAAALAEAMLLLNDNAWATMKVMLSYEAPEETYVKDFFGACVAVAKLQSAAAKAAETKAPVVANFCGLESSNIAVLIFLHDCRLCMTTFGRRKVHLWKTEGDLLRFARPLFKYATGLEVAPGSFDRQIDELADIPLNAYAEHGRQPHPGEARLDPIKRIAIRKKKVGRRS
jgi:hypothetical protein